MRTLDPTVLNEVANHPKVRPWLKGEGEVDLSAMICDPANIALQFEGGGWVLRNLGACQYEVHSLFLPSEDGGMVPIGLSTSAMSRAEMSDMIECIYAFGARHGVEFDAEEARDAYGPEADKP